VVSVGAARAVRAVGYLHSRDTEPWDGHRVPIIGAGKQGHFFVERQVGDQGFNVGGHGYSLGHDLAGNGEEGHRLGRQGKGGICGYCLRRLRARLVAGVE
jgi:hypothetical protein